jgi:formate hydrogenlyase transcriptional activator
MEHFTTRTSDELLPIETSDWQAFFNYCPMGVAIADAEGHYLVANSVFQKILGHTDQELRTMLVADLVHDQNVRDLFATLLENESGNITTEKLYQRDDHSLIWLNVSIYLIPASLTRRRFLMALAEDISERKRAEQELRESEQRLHAILDNSPNMIFLKDSDGRYLLVNREVERALHVTQNQVKAKTDYEIFPAEQAAAFRASDLRVLDAGAPMEFEEVFLQDDGQHTHIVNKFPLCDVLGKIYGIGGIVTDITDRRRLQNELERERDRLRQLLELNNSFASNLDVRQLFRSVSAGLRSVLRPDATVLSLPDGGTDKIRVFAIDFPSGKGALKEGIVYPIEGSIAGTVLRTGKPFFFNELPAWLDPKVHDLFRVECLKSGCDLPLVRTGNVLGVLSLACLRENGFTEQDVTLLAHVADQVAIALENALRYDHVNQSRKRLAEERDYFEGQIRREHGPDEIIGKSANLKGVLKQAETVAKTDSAVLILGETGTGKEKFAHAIHQASLRRDRSLIIANCSSLPAGLLESELFGHERGAFTGAITREIGRVELADKGTLFLDEIGDIPLELQPKLLRVLQEQEFQRLGSTRTIRVDFRLVAATNRDLAQMVQESQFRSDLYYRLNVFPIRIPPLRERREDVPLLAWHFVKKFARRMNKQIDTIRREDIEALTHYDWPGNVRELQNVIERSVVLSPDTVLHLCPLAELGSIGSNASAERQTLAEAERAHILQALQLTDWVIGGRHGAAAQLGLRRTTLLYKMTRLDIVRPAG